jgi:hypothetical protein
MENLRFIRLIVSLILLSGLYLTGIAQSEKIAMGDRFEIFFTNKLTKSDLEKIKAQVTELGIELSYSWTEFDKKGKLTGLAFEAKGFGCEGSARYARIGKQKQFGFFFDNRPGARAACGFGGIGVE